MYYRNKDIYFIIFPLLLVAQSLRYALHKPIADTTRENNHSEIIELYAKAYFNVKKHNQWIIKISYKPLHVTHGHSKYSSTVDTES